MKRKSNQKLWRKFCNIVRNGSSIQQNILVSLVTVKSTTCKWTVSALNVRSATEKVILLFFRSTFKQIHIVRYYEVKLYVYGNIKELSNLLFDNPLTEFKHTYYYFADIKQNFRKMKSLVYSQVLFSISVNCSIYVYNFIDYTSYIYI